MSATITHQPPAVHPAIYARRWKIVLVLAASLMAITVDTTILNVALPTLGRNLHTSTSQLQWVVDAYILVFASLLLSAGALGDRFGRKGALSLGLGIFAAGSLAAGLAHSPTMLIAARCLMGVGGAFIMPTTLSIISNVFVDPAERAKAIAIWTAVAGLGVAIGPLAGGALLSHFSWSSVFYVNVPLCLGILALVKWLVPSSRNPEATSLDLGGLGLSVVALTTLVYGIIEAPTHGWTAPSTLGVWAITLLSGIAFVLTEARAAHPMVDVSVFKNLRFSAASGAITLVHFAIFGVIFVLAAFLQSVLGYSALQAGVRTLPFAIAMMIFAPISPAIVQRFGSKPVVTAGLITMATGMFTVGMSSMTSGYSLVFVSMVVMGTGMALTMAPATESIMGALPKEKAGVGSAINDTTREVGSALGVAVLGSIFSSAYRSGVTHRLTGMGVPSGVIHRFGQSLTSAGTGARHGGTPITVQVHDAIGSSFVHAMDMTMLVAAATVAFGAILAALLLPSRATVAEDVCRDEPVEPALAAA